MMGMGPGMMGMNGGSATEAEHSDIRDLFFNHDGIKRSVTNLPDGIRTVTESDDPQVAATIKKHVAEMGKRVEEGRDPGLPIESPALHSIFRDKDKVKSTYEVTEKGIIVVQTSTDSSAVKALQDHATEVTDLAQRGMVAAQEAMMKNGGGMMGRRMHGAMVEPRH
jgi:tRNA pseudouridine-54 N-methylase